MEDSVGDRSLKRTPQIVLKCTEQLDLIKQANICRLLLVIYSLTALGKSRIGRREKWGKRARGIINLNRSR